MLSLRLAFCFVLTICSLHISVADDLHLNLRYQKETGEKTGRYHRLHRKEKWQANETAIIVCDMWDLHHCYNAVQREGEFAPRLNELLKKARQQGVTIIHSPSSCMLFYKNHAARKRAMTTPKATNLPKEIGAWCYQIPAEERGTYPIDQSDGGEDDDLEEHQKWAEKLTAMGRNPKAPWKRQLKTIDIDATKDYISDKGNEVWNVLEHRKIKNVILTGVHTNMCVLGRPFGLRQMARNGKNVVLVRDMTDTMYNPKSNPFVSHFSGTDLIISHIEKFVCPTITSDQILDGKPFRFKNDKRPHLVIVMAEQGYETNKTLPALAAKSLDKNYRISYVFADEKTGNILPGLEIIQEADVLLLSVRRRLLPKPMMQLVRNYIKAGKPIVALRTSSHAFALRNEEPPHGLADWKKFDHQVFGCQYDGHYAVDIKKINITLNQQQSKHSIFNNINVKQFPFQPGYHLYKFSHLSNKTTVLLQATVEGHKNKVPVTWTFQRKDGGRSFYTSLGNPIDFKNPIFRQMLINGIDWAVSVQ